jgi:hypothetical protein
MFDRVRALDLIDRAIDSDPYCPVCHAPTQITDADGHVLLECSAASAPTDLIGRISATLLPHLRFEVVDLSQGVAA